MKHVKHFEQYIKESFEDEEGAWDEDEDDDDDEDFSEFAHNTEKEREDCRKQLDEFFEEEKVSVVMISHFTYQYRYNGLGVEMKAYKVGMPFDKEVDCYDIAEDCFAEYFRNQIYDEYHGGSAITAKEVKAMLPPGVKLVEYKEKVNLATVSRLPELDDDYTFEHEVGSDS